MTNLEKAKLILQKMQQADLDVVDPSTVHAWDEEDLLYFVENYEPHYLKS